MIWLLLAIWTIALVAGIACGANGVIDPLGRRK